MPRALVALPYARTRRLAREWLESDQTSRRRAASSILRAHEPADDVPTIREDLRRERLDCPTSDMHFVCNLVTALARADYRNEPEGEASRPLLLLSNRGRLWTPAGAGVVCSSATACGLCSGGLVCQGSRSIESEMTPQLFQQKPGTSLAKHISVPFAYITASVFV